MTGAVRQFGGIDDDELAARLRKLATAVERGDVSHHRVDATIEVNAGDRLRATWTLAFTTAEDGVVWPFDAERREGDR